MKHTKSFQELQKSFSEVYQWFSSLKEISLSQLPTDKTAHIIVDMINGFVKTGALSSKEVLSINNSVADFAAVCTKNNIPNIALADSHSKESVEFRTFPVHCLDGTYESEVTDEIKKSSDFTVVKKNSTNGFLEPQFADIISQTDKNIFIVTGDCTDMCVIQFALTLKADFNRRNMESRVIVPYELTATCSMPNHEPELAEIMALYIMNTNGIETVKNIIAD
ncbi:MAG: cysteine hydrolase family protein [Acutalibacteraceae bacterium]